MLEIIDGRKQFYQWDKNQRLLVNNDLITEVHYSNNDTQEALVCGVYEENGKRYANVPNILLQKRWDIKAYGCCAECVRAAQVFSVAYREKPADYVYEETEVIRYSTLHHRLQAVENTYAAVGYVDNAVSDKATVKYVDSKGSEIKGYVDNAVSDKATTGYVDKAVSNVKVDLTGYATEEYVNKAVDNVSVDLSGYATEKYVDDAISNVVIEGGNVQSDWNQNDSTKPDYIKNRLCYGEFETIVEATAQIGAGDSEFPNGYIIEGLNTDLLSLEDTYYVTINDDTVSDMAITMIEDMPCMGSYVVAIMVTMGLSREVAKEILATEMGYVEETEYNFFIGLLGDVALVFIENPTSECYVRIDKGTVVKKIPSMYIPKLPYLAKSEVVENAKSYSITWDGSTEGKVVVNGVMNQPEGDTMYYCKVSNAIPTAEQLNNGSVVWVEDGETKHNLIKNQDGGAEDKGNYISAVDGMLMVIKQPQQVGEIYYPSAGTYFINIDVMLQTNKRWQLRVMAISLDEAIFDCITIKPELMPNEVATKAYVDNAVSEGEYELIETITVNEDMAVTRTAEPNGTPYNFSALYIEISSTLENVEGYNIYLGWANGESAPYWVDRYTGNTGKTKKISYLECVKINGLYHTRYRTHTTNNYITSVQECVVAKASGNIIKIDMRNIVPAGITFNIWGVRA